MKKEELILGVDPGTTILGWSLLKVTGKQSELVAMDVLKLNKLPDQAAKLKTIFEFILEKIIHYQPTILSIEAPFFGKNPQSMIKLGRAQGVVIAACLHQNMDVFEYSPRKIKQSITGNGNASKEQVAAMLKNMYPSVETAKYLDATDALAAAVCHHLQNKFDTNEPKLSGWGSFVSKNSDRIIK
ncbi:MAG: crossover junction endodeoxyribonuclease RuvC [Bacteroidales bacterium]|jgi:crossover junction endodeoxyribonuclease RuvC|nr:crossover junction endodeoxyribonuclease RuvC [Bacteroidales bacterium]